MYKTLYFYFCKLRHAHHQKFSFCSSPYKQALLPVLLPPPLVITPLSLYLCFCLDWYIHLFYLCMFVCVLYSRCEWNHTVFVFLHLNYFYYAYYTLKESGGLQSHKVTNSRT